MVGAIEGGSSVEVSGQDRGQELGHTDVDDVVPVLRPSVLDESLGCFDGCDSPATREDEVPKVWK